MIKRQHTEYLWITYPVVSLSQSSASAAYWLCMTEDLNNNFFLSQKSSKYLCKKKRILGIFGRNIVLKEVIFCPIIPLLSASFYNVNNFCAMYSCKWMLHLQIPCVFQWFKFPTPPWQDSNSPPPPPARNKRQMPISFQVVGILKLQVNQQ